MPCRADFRRRRRHYYYAKMLMPYATFRRYFFELFASAPMPLFRRASCAAIRRRSRFRRAHDAAADTLHTYRE